MAVMDGAVIVEGKGAVLEVSFGRPTVTNWALLRSCARATRSSRIILGGLVHFCQATDKPLSETSMISNIS